MAAFSHSCKDILVYKYGGLDARFNNLGGMQCLFWEAIQEAKNSGLSQFDLGRSDWDDQGLIVFKDRWGASRSTVGYWRHGAASDRRITSGWQARIARRIFGHMPIALLPLGGSLLYRHYA